MRTLYHTVITSARHRRLGFCHTSDFGEISLIELPQHKKQLVISFVYGGVKQEFIKHEGFIYSRVNNFIKVGKDEEVNFLSKQGRYCPRAVIDILLVLRKRFETTYVGMPNKYYVIIGKTLFERYCTEKELFLTYLTNVNGLNKEYSINVKRGISNENSFNLNKTKFKELVGIAKKTIKKDNCDSALIKLEKIKWGQD